MSVSQFFSLPYIPNNFTFYRRDTEHKRVMDEVDVSPLHEDHK